ncbi:MAG: hypothetical protein JF589_00820 [Gemmatimonadetes bacterium]|nr:hypothetical protein [Gemmatimonadota bacterium]
MTRRKSFTFTSGPIRDDSGGLSEVMAKSPTFNVLFDRAVAACAEAQRLSGRTAESVRKARLERASARRVRTLIAETRETWEGANAMYAVMRVQVEQVAREMRDAGVDSAAAAATIRQHIRFVLYDGGLTERDAEPVVTRASTWVDMVFAAA